MTDAEDFLAHFGVRGMKWGVRREDPSGGGDGGGGLSTKQKVVIGGAVVVGVAITGAILVKSGKVDISAAQATIAKGKEFVEKARTPQAKAAMAAAVAAKRALDAEAAAMDKPKPSYESKSYGTYKKLSETLPADKFLVWDRDKNDYVVSDTHGYNPNNNRFGRNSASEPEPAKPKFTRSYNMNADPEATARRARDEAASYQSPRVVASPPPRKYKEGYYEPEEFSARRDARVRKQAHDYWTSPAGKTMAKNLNMDWADIQKKLDDPDYIWEL